MKFFEYKSIAKKFKIPKNNEFIAYILIQFNLASSIGVN